MSLKSIDPNVWALLGALWAMDLDQGMDLDDKNIFGNFLTGVGGILLTMAAVEEAKQKTAEEQATKAKTKEEQGKETEPKKQEGAEDKTEGAPAQPAESNISAQGEKDFTEHERENICHRIEQLEQQVRVLFSRQ